MTTYGVTPSGFVKKTYDTILSEITARAQTSFGGAIDLTPTSVFYQFLQVEQRLHASFGRHVEDQRLI